MLSVKVGEDLGLRDLVIMMNGVFFVDCVDGLKVVGMKCIIVSFDML